MRNGVDLDVAFALDDVTRTAWSIIFSEQEGAKFSFDTMAFKKDQS